MSAVSSPHSSPSIEIRRHSPETPWTYELLDRHQREVAARVRDGGGGALILSEVAPVITLGRRIRGVSGEPHLLLSPAELLRRGVSVYPTDRGGFGTYHGPGQWVLFVVDRLDRLTGDPRGIKRAVEGLLEVACQVAQGYESRAEIRSGCETGVWTPRGKVASVGVHVEEGVLLHGLSLNGFATSTSFLGLRPCGLDAEADYLLKDQDSVASTKGFEELGQRLVKLAVKKFWDQ